MKKVQLFSYLCTKDWIVMMSYADIYKEITPVSEKIEGEIVEFFKERGADCLDLCILKEKYKDNEGISSVLNYLQVEYTVRPHICALNEPAVIDIINTYDEHVSITFGFKDTDYTITLPANYIVYSLHCLLLLMELETHFNVDYVNNTLAVKNEQRFNALVEHIKKLDSFRTEK